MSACGFTGVSIEEEEDIDSFDSILLLGRIYEAAMVNRGEFCTLFPAECAGHIATENGTCFANAVCEASDCDLHCDLGSC